MHMPCHSYMLLHSLQHVRGMPFFLRSRVYVCVRVHKQNVHVFVCLSILVPRSHMTPPPACLQCLGLFLNIPCAEVQRVVYRDFPFLRVLLCLSASLSHYWFFQIRCCGYIFETSVSNQN